MFCQMGKITLVSVAVENKVPSAGYFEILSVSYFRLVLESSDVWHRWDSC